MGLPIQEYIDKHTHRQHEVWLAWFQLCREHANDPPPAVEKKKEKTWAEMTYEERRDKALMLSQIARAQWEKSIVGTENGK